MKREGEKNSIYIIGLHANVFAKLTVSVQLCCSVMETGRSVHYIFKMHVLIFETLPSWIISLHFKCKQVLKTYDFFSWLFDHRSTNIA